MAGSTRTSAPIPSAEAWISSQYQVEMSTAEWKTRLPVKGSER